MAKTLNLIIVDDMALVKPLAERLGFKEAPWCLTDPIWGSQEGITSTLLRQTRNTDEKISDDLLFYFVVDTDDLVVARNVGGWYHLSVAFKSAGLPSNLDVEFDRIMLTTGFERFVAKDRHVQVFGGWHDHANESRRYPLPQGGHIMVNDEDPATAHYGKPGKHLTMKPEYLFSPRPSNPNRSDFNWLMVDDVARLDEWAERLNILNFKPLGDVLNEGLTGLESAMEAAQHRKSNVAQIISSLTEDTTFYTVVPEVMLKAAMISYDYREVVFREAGVPNSLLFLPRNAAFITKDYFLSIRDKRGDNWSVHQKDAEHHDKGWLINAAYHFAANTMGLVGLPQTYDECMNSRTHRIGRGLATTVDDTWLRQQLEAAGKPEDREFFNQWTVQNNGIFDEATMKKLRESPSLGEKGSFSRELFTEAQLKRMQDIIPDVFLADGTIDIAVLSKYYESKAALIAPGMRRRVFPRGTMPVISEASIEGSRTDLGLVYLPPMRTIYESGQSVLADDFTKLMLAMLSEPTPPKPPLVPSAVLDTINKYLDEVKDKPVTPFDDVQIEGGEDGLSFTVTFTTTDPVMKDLLLKAGAVAVPDLGRGLTPEATQQLFREQNPHMFEERPVKWDELLDTGKPTLFPPKDPE